MTRKIGAVAWALILGTMGVGCEEDPPDPNLAGGAGIRYVFPAGTDGLEGVRVSLWHRNDVLPPGCALGSAPAGTASAAGLPSREYVLFVPAAGAEEPDSCTRMSVQIWNLIGKPVRTVADTPFVDRLAWGWDLLDDRGEAVPSGYYPTFSKCLDSRGSFTFSGHYDVLRDRERGACEWPLWIEDIAPGGGRFTREFGPFPDAVGTVRIGENGEWQELVTFVNPFLVRAHADGMETFEAEVILVDGQYSEVDVVWTPLATGKGEMP